MSGLMKSFFGDSTPTLSPAPQPPAPGNSAADSAAAQAAAEERKRQMAASGRASTILTGGTGDTTQAVTASKMLLGQ